MWNKPWDREKWDREHWERWMDTVRSNQRDPDDHFLRLLDGQHPSKVLQDQLVAATRAIGQCSDQGCIPDRLGPVA